MLAGHRRVIAYDLRGHGRSPWSGPHTLHQHTARPGRGARGGRRRSDGAASATGSAAGSRSSTPPPTASGSRRSRCSTPAAAPSWSRCSSWPAAERRGQVFASADAAIAELAGLRRPAPHPARAGRGGRRRAPGRRPGRAAALPLQPRRGRRRAGGDGGAGREPEGGRVPRAASCAASGSDLLTAADAERAARRAAPLPGRGRPRRARAAVGRARRDRRARQGLHVGPHARRGPNPPAPDRIALSPTAGVALRSR